MSPLAVGTEAPDFTLRDQNQQEVSLSDFRGAKNVLLVFFPLAFTGICQGELDEVRDHLPEYENDDTATLAREHNDANVISIGARNHAEADAFRFVELFLATPFSQGERHRRRIAQLAEYETTGAIAGHPTA